MPKDIEIERKWLMIGFPEFSFTLEANYRQDYLSFDDNEVRISCNELLLGNHYKITVKQGEGLVRPEFETYISAENYNILIKSSLGGANKLYRNYKLPSGHKLSVAFVDNKWYYAEIEFNSEEEANSYVAEFDFIEEVTGDKNYSMSEYCKNKNK